MDEKRCEWCGTVSPVEAEKCALCRIPFSAPVPPPQDWSHLTGNIPVITAPLLETPAEAPAEAAPVTEAAAAPVIPQQVQREPLVAEPVVVRQGAGSSESVAGARGPLGPSGSIAQDVVRSLSDMATGPAVTTDAQPETRMPGWRTPDDPTLRVFADQLEERERRRRGGNATNRRGRRRRRLLARLLIRAVAIGLIAAVILLAPARLPSF